MELACHDKNTMAKKKEGSKQVTLMSGHLKEGAMYICLKWSSEE